MTEAVPTADLPDGGSAVPYYPVPSAHGPVTVSMPYYRTPTTVRTAVLAVLEQTYADLLLYVVNDGDHSTPPWPFLDDITDSRLIRVDLPANRGRYFADAVVLAACDTPWFAIHDTDDAADPDWLTELINACQDNDWTAAFGPQLVVRGDEVTVEPVASPLVSTPGRLRHLAHHAAVYRTHHLRAVGGPHPRYRIGYDTAMVNFMAMNGPVGAVDRPLYTRLIRPDSLTTAPATRRGSVRRRAVRKELELMTSRARSSGVLWTVEHDIGPELAAEVKAAAEMVRSGQAVPAPVPDQPTGGIVSEDVWTGWALDKHTAEELAAHLHRTQPRTVMETGSGMSTVLLAEYAARTGATVISLEHDPTYADATLSQLRTRGLADRVDLRRGPIHDIDTPAGRLPWYDIALSGAVDFALVDGPPGKIGRAGALFGLWERLAPGWQVWLDDADRPGERNALTLWTKHLPVNAELLPTPKGLGRVFPAGTLRHPWVNAQDVAVTLLTGGRPDLLAATVTSILAAAPGLLETAHVAVLNNGACEATAELIATWDWVDVSTAIADRLPVGMGASALLGYPPPRPYTLHLEDDWQLATTVPGWLDEARNLLDGNTMIGQVRLRHMGDAVRREHMVTRKPIWWRPWQGTALAAPAHYTLNPSLMRSEAVAELWPAADEITAARTFYARGWLAAQLRPGAFRHIGGGASLRLGQR